MKESITLENYITANKKYMGRMTDPGLTMPLLANAKKLLQAVNAFLNDLSYTTTVIVSSGYRPAKTNANVPNASKTSLHMRCMAVDILDDKKQTLATLCSKHPDLLRKYGLFLEDPASTVGQNTNWTHLDISDTRSDRPSRIFKP